MTDIVQRLRAVSLYEGHGEESSLPEQAADTIEALQARVTELERTAAGWEASAEMEARAHWAARARVRALEEGLRPIADRAASYDGVPPPKYFGDTDCELRFYDDAKAQITVGDLRRARDVLKGEADEQT